MKSKLTWMLTLLLVLTMSFSFSQEKTISGNVTNQDGLVLPGVSIVVLGTTNGTQTNFDGNYTIIASQGQVLQFSYIGQVTVERTIGTANTINVQMEEDVESLDEVIVTAYGTTTKEAFTGSASVLGAEDLAIRNVTSPIAAIEGRATGVQFTSTNGQPGSTPNIVIRGVGTLTGDTDPLFIVDGIQFEGNLNTINQEDIESFTILKDAASTALYGSRAANGVVIITTKSGTRGGTQVTASMQYGLVTRAVPPFDRIGPEQYYEIMWEALKNSSAGGGDPAFASANIYNQLGYNPFNVPNDQIVGTDGRINPNAEVIYQSLDWFDVLERTGVRQNYNVNVSGGGEDHKVFFSASYLNEEGFAVTSSFERLTARLNAEFDVSDRIKMGGSANITIAEAVGPSSAGQNSIVNPFGFANNVGAVYPVYVNDLQGNLVRDEFGELVFDNGEGFAEFNIGSRPINQGRHALQELLLNDERDRDNTYGFRFFADWEILNGLNLRLNYGRDINEELEKEYENEIIGDAQPDGRYSEERARREVENFNQILTYVKSFGNHNLDITAGHESFRRTFSQNEGLATVQTASGIFEFANFSNIVDLDGLTTEKGLEGYFLRTNYNYDNKYYLSASVRRDGSSVFERDSRWGTFFSLGGSWRIDQEKFMENVSFVNSLKLRASYGEVGNDALGSVNTFGVFVDDFFISQPRFTIISNAAAPGAIFTDLGNSILRWETLENYDVALEFALFDNFLEGTVEYYRRNSSDLLIDLPIAPSNGINSFPSNTGDMFNEGWEIGLTTHLINTGDFRWDLTLQGSTFNNEITSLPTPFIQDEARWAEGRSRFDFFLWKIAGVDPDNGNQLFLMYELDENGESVPVLDANGNQMTTNNWRETERAYTGDSAVPDLLGSIANSFSYKGFSLDVLITYGIGGKVLDRGYFDIMHSGAYGRALHPDIMNAWRQPGDITNVPRMENGNPNLVRELSDRFLTDASFWSLRNVNIGYSFNRQILDVLGLNSLRVTLTGENLFLKSKRTGLDPQFEFAGAPQGNDFSPARYISMGLNVSF
ncbi:SusC/RagA family TonB-linked outer membrane protein [Muricauda sp. SCSIO 64092]|uniref:SusC/RagA family TonB-linked outer membrane protein n=1 Tax=Allomuricauda sp. SCSIO 64092 TaxID=2908842 RepID=UPI001FF58A59|nr:SusC/RagA family TonB-linked outer membrane protein [Muricauda sp. SCSIO 64092]UOY05374.1 SusC/RagA family TonB-linked outer membrane protein [Muricauda sp. SCSIO 64092]